MTAFTLMTYNIEWGFHTPKHVYEEHRVEAAQSAVAKVDPDLLALTEACYGDGRGPLNIFMQYDRIFGFPHIHWGDYPVFGKSKGNFGGNCLLSKYPLVGETIHFSHKGAVRALVDIEGSILMIDVVHPSYSVDDAVKIKDLEQLVDGQTDSYVLTGDFNAVHPDDVIDFERLAVDMGDYDRANTTWLLENWKKAECVRWILQQGLLDAFPVHARSSTVPTSSAYGRPQKGVRLDFAFHTPDIRVVDAYVLKDADTEIASDHYPIVIVFEI